MWLFLFDREVVKTQKQAEKLKHTGGNGMEEAVVPAAQNNDSEVQGEKNQQTNGDVPESKTEAQSKEKMVPKELFDRKISELVKENKALKSQVKEKMPDDERMAAEQAEKDAELQAVKNELAALKTESALTSAGVDVENAKVLSTAIIGGDAAKIVEAIKAAIKAAEKAASAKTTKELLEGGSPQVRTAAATKEKPDPRLEIVKNAAASSKPAISKSDSKWFK